MSDPSELNKAIKAHSIWKIRLKDAVDSGKSEFTPTKLRDSHICDFGKWFGSLPQAEKNSDACKNIQVLHDKFHMQAADVLQMALNGQKEKAHTALTDLKSDFVYTSAQLINLLGEWKRQIS